MSPRWHSSILVGLRSGLLASVLGLTIPASLQAQAPKAGDPFRLVGMSKPQKDWMGGSGERVWGYSVTVLYQAPNPAVGAPVSGYVAISETPEGLVYDTQPHDDVSGHENEWGKGDRTLR